MKTVYLVQVPAVVKVGNTILERLVEGAKNARIEQIINLLVLNLFNGSVNILHGGDALDLVQYILFDHLWSV